MSSLAVWMSQDSGWQCLEMEAKCGCVSAHPNFHMKPESCDCGPLECGRRTGRHNPAALTWGGVCLMCVSHVCLRVIRSQPTPFFGAAPWRASQPPSSSVWASSKKRSWWVRRSGGGSWGEHSQGRPPRS